MEAHVDRLESSQDFLRHIHDRRNKINLIREDLDTLLERHLVHRTYDLAGETARKDRERAGMLLELTFLMANSWHDAVLQIINAEILDKPMAEAGVSLHTIKERILEGSEIKTALCQVSSSARREYISDVANTLKHRRLIKVDFAISSDGLYGPKINEIGRAHV